MNIAKCHNNGHYIVVPENHQEFTASGKLNRKHVSFTCPKCGEQHDSRLEVLDHTCAQPPSHA